MVEVYISEESEDEVTVLRQEGSSKSESCQELSIWTRKVVSTLDGPIWSRYSIALTYTARSHFQRKQIKKTWDGGWNKRYHSSREGEE